MEYTTMNDCFDLVVKEYRLKQNRSMCVLENNLTHLRPRLGGTYAERFKGRDWKDYIDFRRNEGAANATINRERSTVTYAGTLAEEEYGIKFPSLLRLKENNVRTGFYTLKDVETIKEFLFNVNDGERRKVSIQCARVFIFGYYNGWRLGEILSVERKYFDPQTGFVGLDWRDSKNEECRYIPLTGECLQATIDAFLVSQELNSPYLFCNQFGRRIPMATYYTYFRPALAAAGYKPGERRFHDCRRTATTIFDQAGVPRRTAMAFTGHKSESHHIRYNIGNAAHMMPAAAKRDAYLEQIKQSRVVNGDNGQSVAPETRYREQPFKKLFRTLKNILSKESN